VQQNENIPQSKSAIAKWEGTMLEMLEVAEHSIAEKMEGNHSPRSLARAAVLGLCRTFGGSVFYLPMGAVAERKARDFDIYTAWRNNVSIPQLAKEYRLANQTIYDIVARERKAATQENSQVGSSK
jgi:Mor family transcriptional regulator